MISRQSLARMIAVGVVAAAFAPLGFAAEPATIDVKVSVAKACSVAATVDVDFGSHDGSFGSATALEKGGTISVKCRKQADSVTVRLQKSGGNVAGGTMTSGSGDTLAYTLYKPVTTSWDTSSAGTCAYTTAWDSAGLDLGTISNSGTMLVGVCAKTTIDDSTPSGDYSDTLTVLLDY